MKANIDRLDLLIFGLIAIILALVMGISYWSVYGGM